MEKRHVVRETWVANVPILDAMASVIYLQYALETDLVYDAVRSIPATRSYQGHILISCTSEQQCDTILEAVEKARSARIQEVASRQG
jgi:hypothetical protein